MTSDDALWKRRFLMFTAVRLGALALVLIGLALGVGDFLPPGGWRILGGILVLIAIAILIVVPRRLRKSWESK